MGTLHIGCCAVVRVVEPRSSGADTAPLPPPATPCPALSSTACTADPCKPCDACLLFQVDVSNPSDDYIWQILFAGENDAVPKRVTGEASSAWSIRSSHLSEVFAVAFSRPSWVHACRSLRGPCLHLLAGVQRTPT